MLPQKQQSAAPPTPRAPSTPLLIHLSTPRATPPVHVQKPTPTAIRAPPPPSWLNSLPRRSSPLKQVFDSELSTSLELDAGASPLRTVRRVASAEGMGADKENEAGAPAGSPSRKVFAGGKKWAVVQEERTRVRSSSRSPVKELLAHVGDQSHGKLLPLRYHTYLPAD